MHRPEPTNAALVRDLRALDPNGGFDAAIEHALGVPAGALADPAVAPVLGHHLERGDGVVVFVLTPGRLLRYETLGGQSLSVLVPLARVTQVVERRGPSGELSVTVELDADALTVESETLAQPDGVMQVGRGLARVRRTGYVLTAQLDPAHGAPLYALAAALSSRLGV